MDGRSSRVAAVRGVGDDVGEIPADGRAAVGLAVRADAGGLGRLSVRRGAGLAGADSGAVPARVVGGVEHVGRCRAGAGREGCGFGGVGKAGSRVAGEDLVLARVAQPGVRAFSHAAGADGLDDGVILAIAAGGLDLHRLDGVRGPRVLRGARAVGAALRLEAARHDQRFPAHAAGPAHVLLPAVQETGVIC